MIQKFLTKYWLSVHLLALFIVISLSIFSAEHLGSASVFWLAFLGIEALLLLPTVFKEESLAEARKRVVRSLEDDACTYVGMLLVLLIGIQWLNSGCTLVYFPDADVWKYSMPPLEWLPYSIEPRPALALFSWGFTLFTGLLIIRNGLGKGGRHFFLEWASVLSGMIAAYSVYQSHVGAAPYAQWALRPGASNLGAFFALWFLVASGRDLTSGRSSPTAGLLKAVFWWVFAFVGNLAGVLQFSSGMGVLVFSGLGLFVFIYRLVILGLQRIGFAKQFRLGMGIIVAVSMIVGTILFLLPASPVKPKVLGVKESSYWSELTASRNLRTTAALKIWEEVPWTGVGPLGFSHHLGTVIEDEEWKYAREDRRFVWNDALQFLCEWGVIGSGLLLALVIVLLIPLFVRLRDLFSKRQRSEDSVGEIYLSLDPYLVPGLVATVALLVYGWFSSLLQQPITLLSWFFIVALLPGLLPSRQARKIN